MKRYQKTLTLLAISVSTIAANNTAEYPTKANDNLSPSQGAGFMIMARGAAKKNIFSALFLMATGYVIALNSKEIDEHFQDPSSPANQALCYAGCKAHKFLADLMRNNFTPHTFATKDENNMHDKTTEDFESPEAQSHQNATD